MSPRYVLVGPPGAGKTTVGRLLAERLGVPFRDTDADIEQTAGKEIADIFYADGEEHFRALERSAVAAALLEHEGVLALGGGAVLSEDTRALLRGHVVVLLEVGLSAAAERVGLNRTRPVLALNPRAQLRSLLADRLPLYAEVATRTVGTDSRTPEQVVDAVLDGGVTGGLVARVVPVLLFLVGATVLAGLVGAAGVFEAAAVRAARMGRGNRWALLALVAALATFTTVLLSLDTTAVLVTPVALALAARLDVPPWPYAFCTVWLAGTASLLLPVSNLTNLLAAPRISASTTSFVTHTLPVWAVTVAVTLAVLAVTSRTELRGRYRVPEPDPPADPLLFRAAAVAVVVFAVLLAAGQPAWVAAAATALPLAVVARLRVADVQPLRLVPWVLVVAVSALFAVVTGLGPHGLDALLEHVAGTGGGLRLSATAAAGGNLVDNLPAYLALERVAPDRHTVALLVGVDAGTLLTPWGSLATLLWAGSVRAAGLRVPWRSFVLRGLVLVPAVLLLTAPLL